MPDWVQLSLIPLITAFVGWYTNFLAVRFLFRPYNPIKIGPWTLHGLIPRRQKEIAEQIAETFEREFIDSRSIAGHLESIDVEPHLDKLATRVIRGNLMVKMQSIPLLGSFITEDTLATVELTVKEEMLAEAKPLLQHIAGELEEGFDVREKIREPLLKYSPKDLEAVIKSIARKELKAIEWMGALLGLIAGIIQLAILWAAGYIQI